MTILNRPIRPRPPARRSLPTPVTAKDLEKFYALTDELNGQPVPGVRMTEA